MSEVKKIKAQMKYKLRGDTDENWSALNPILSLREPGLVVDENGKTVAFKIGDGVTAWNELEYLNVGGGESITIDQTYSPESENAQSGKAVAEAIEQSIGDISTALDELHIYAQALINGGATE